MKRAIDFKDDEEFNKYLLKKEQYIGTFIALSACLLFACVLFSGVLGIP